MSNKNYQWIQIAHSENELVWSEKGIALVAIGVKKICILKFKEGCFGFNEICPHAGSSLADGFVDGSGNIVCPVHGYKFNLRHGWDSNGEGYHLKTYPVECRPDGIFIGLELTSSL